MITLDGVSGKVLTISFVRREQIVNPFVSLLGIVNPLRGVTLAFAAAIMDTNSYFVGSYSTDFDF